MPPPEPGPAPDAVPAQLAWQELLACPACAGVLSAAAGTPEVAALSCSECGRRFPVIRGIPRMVAELGDMAEVARSFSTQWQEQRAGTFECDTIYGESTAEELRVFLERFGLPTDATAALRGQRVLDAGCGSGRLTQSIAAHGAEAVVGLDVSDSVEIANDRMGKRANALIVQGNLLEPPLKRRAFDLVWSEGVIHHTPDARRAFARLAELVKPGGRMYVWLYPPSFNPYRVARDVLPFAWRLPRRWLVRLCFALAIPLWACGGLFCLLLGKRVRAFREVAFSFHDNLSPRYQSRHRVAEVEHWFRDAGFVDIRSVFPPTGLVGTMPRSAPERP